MNRAANPRYHSIVGGSRNHFVALYFDLCYKGEKFSPTWIDPHSVFV